ncbi:hypothetical protein ABPG74_011054 [Tetrahymena malaccensis]
MDQERTLKNLLDKKTLKWIFVGGKGGVGKTTTSSSLATLLAQNGVKVLIISTDPAHNLCDCFDQKFSGKEPTPVAGIENLWGMEIDPTIDPNSLNFPDFEGFETDQSTKNFLSEIISQVPGIDEAMSFSALIKSLDKYNFDVVVFDTAPTGHTLRLLNFPNLLEKGIEKIIALKNKFQGILSSIAGQSNFDKLFGDLEEKKKTVQLVVNQMKDPNRTTFVAVCIPEFLSMYETDRLVYELAKYEIDIQNIVINQVLYPNDTCKMCKSRAKMQKKYMDQILELYEDLHVVIVPLQESEVRGVENLKKFCQLLLTQQEIPKIPE